MAPFLCNHDTARAGKFLVGDTVKMGAGLLSLMNGNVFVYYGDEIGMDCIEGLPSKEGGYIRTGSRTPMQWHRGKNHGFSNSNTPYLPTDPRENAPTVADQENDPDSLLSFVKQLIALRRNDPRLWADGAFEILLPSYPFVYTRMKNGKKLLIAINPSARSRYYDGPTPSRILLSQNVSIEDGRLTLGGVSFLIAEE